MPYIGASNLSTNSFINLKEKHSIKNRISETGSHSNANSNSGSVSIASTTDTLGSPNLKQITNMDNYPTSDFSTSDVSTPLKHSLSNSSSTMFHKPPVPPAASSSPLPPAPLDEIRALSLDSTSSTSIDLSLIHI